MNDTRTCGHAFLVTSICERCRDYWRTSVTDEMKLAQEAYQAQLEHYRTAYEDPFCEDEFVEQMDEDLLKAWKALEAAHKKHARMLRSSASC